MPSFEKITLSEELSSGAAKSTCHLNYNMAVGKEAQKREKTECELKPERIYSRGKFASWPSARMHMEQAPE